MIGSNSDPVGVAEWFPNISISSPSSQLSSPACAVILAATKGASLFPLTSAQSPKHLMPVAGIPCILRLLEELSFHTPHVVVAIAADDAVTIPALQQVAKLQKSHQSSTHDVTNDEGQPMLYTLIKIIDDKDRRPHQYARTCISVVRLTDDSFGSVDALRQLEETKVIPESVPIVVIPGDLVILQRNLRLTDLFRPKPNVACTALLVDVGEQDENGVPLKESSKAKKGGLSRDDEDIEYVALSQPPLNVPSSEPALPRIVWKKPKMEVETDHDMTGSSIKLEIPKARLRHGKVTIRMDWNDVHVYSFAPWIRKLVMARENLINIQEDLIPLLISRQFKGKKATFGESVSESTTLSSDKVNSPVASATPAATDTSPYSVLACVVPNDDLLKNAALRVNTIPAYLYACREVVAHSLPVPAESKRNGKFRTLVLDKTELGSKINMKDSVIGASCQLGAKCRLNNVVVMDGTVIGDNCSLQNSIIGPGAKLGNNCSLNDCQVVGGKEIPTGTKEKGEAFLAGDGVEDALLE